MQLHNFGAGPSILPDEVLQEASKAVINYNSTGLSLLEVSHRSKWFLQILDDAKNLVRELLNVPSDYHILFLHGGASTQFAMVPYNLLRENGKALYLNTGVWSQKAIKEASMLGRAEILASSEDKNFSYLPEIPTIPDDADYLHLTSNNTIYGTQLKAFPKSNIPVVCDMSSDIFSRAIDVSNFGLIYAGAQKNMGVAGATLVIIKDSLIGQSKRKINSMLDYKVHIDADSLYNTAPVFSIYVSLLTLQWLKKNGGVAAMEKRSNQKAEMLYAAIDESTCIKGNVEKSARSNMNVCFNAKIAAHEKQMEEYFTKHGIVGIKGHRLSGGFRASLYNALPISSVEYLCELIRLMKF